MDTASNATELTVTELSAALKRTVEDAFGYVRLRGEISGFKGPHASGHCYFALKDEGARIDAIIWKGTFGKMKVKPEEGLEVIVTGRVTTYPGRSSYQIVIETLEPAGLGALMALLEERKKKLAKEGLFDDARKQLLPYLPVTIGVITSPTGAVIRDILHRLNDRFARHVIVWPVRVQGDTSAAEVAAAIDGFNAMAADGAIRRPDVLIVARGGGSLEDLWSFNEEIVVRAAAASDIPLISAVGHETDVTLIDWAADRRAPTPTAAAEMAVPVRAELLTRAAALHARHVACWQRGLENRRKELRALERALPKRERIFEQQRQRLDSLAERLPRALRTNAVDHRQQFERAAARLSPQVLRGRAQQGRERIEAFQRRAQRCLDAYLTRRYDRLEALEQLLQAFSYRRVLARGYALVRDDAGKPVREAAAIANGTRLDLEFADGRVKATAGESEMRPAAAPRPPRRRRMPDPGQGDLF